MGVINCRDALSKRKPLRNTTLLWNLKRLSGFPTDSKAAQQLVSVVCALETSDNFGISAFLLSVMPSNEQTYRIKGAKATLVSPMVSSCSSTIRSTHSRHVKNIERTKTSSFNVVVPHI